MCSWREVRCELVHCAVDTDNMCEALLQSPAVWLFMYVFSELVVQVWNEKNCCFFWSNLFICLVPWHYLVLSFLGNKNRNSDLFINIVHFLKGWNTKKNSFVLFFPFHGLPPCAPQGLNKRQMLTEWWKWRGKYMKHCFCLEKRSPSSSLYVLRIVVFQNMRNLSPPWEF